MKIIKDVKIPFVMEGRNRIDDNKALREALANCLINADYYGTRGIVIKNEPDKLILENPGYIRTGKAQMLKGGESDPRNKSLMKMFNLINIGERSGSGVPLILNTWEDEGWEKPVIEERFDPDRTILELEFVKKTSEENKRRKTGAHIEKIQEYLGENGASKTKDIAAYIGLSPARTRAILAEMGNVEIIGTNTNRQYKLKKRES